MLLTTLANNLLLLLRYPRLSPTPLLSGTYSVGAIQTRLPGSTACQVHYPTVTTSSSTKNKNNNKKRFSKRNNNKRRRNKFSLQRSSNRRPYFRPEALDGLADFSQTSRDALGILSAKNHPCIDIMDDLGLETWEFPNDNNFPNNGNNDDDDESSSSSSTTLFSNNKKKFPIVLFSHGLGGCMEMYSELCRNLASHGYVVIALEHEDGSACYAETADGEQIYYKKPPNDTPYSRERVLNFRQPFLDHRVGEVERALEYLFSQNGGGAAASTTTTITTSDEKNDLDSFLDDKSSEVYGTYNNSSSVLNSLLMDRILLSIADTSQGVSLVGHSFGAATMALATQQLSSSSLSPQTKYSINSVTFLDPWAFALPDHVLSKGIQKQIPVLSILSESWTKSPELPQALELLKSSDNAMCLWAPSTVHASVADSSGWLPGFLARRLGLRGGENKHEIHRVVAEVCAEHIGQSPATTSSLISSLCIGDVVDEKNSGRFSSSSPSKELLQPFSLD